MAIRFSKQQPRCRAPELNLQIFIRKARPVKTRRLRYLILAADLVWIMAAMNLACRGHAAGDAAAAGLRSIFSFTPQLLSALFLWSGLSSWLRLEGFRGGWWLPAVLSQLIPAVAALVAAVFAGSYIARVHTSPLVVGYFAVLLLPGFVLIRCAARWALALRSRLGSVRRIVIVGDGSLAEAMASTIDRHPEWLCQIVGVLRPEETASEPSVLEPGEGASESVHLQTVHLQTVGIVDLLQSYRVDEIVLTVPAPGHSEILDLAATCRNAGLAVSLVPQPYELYLSKPELLDLDGLPLLRWAPGAAANPVWKRVLDVIVTLCLLPLALAAVVPAALVLKLRKGKAFRRELRCEQQGKTFRMYRLNSDRHATALPAYEALMQHSSLTELPQLINVLRGEMSLVGPRPEGPERTRHYSDWNQERLSVKPGITGLAQVHGLREHNSSEDKTRYDLQYILHRSPFQDISILLQTLWTIAVRLLQWLDAQASNPQVAIERLEIGSRETGTHEIDRQRGGAPALATSLEEVFQETLSRAHSSQSSSD